MLNNSYLSECLADDRKADQLITNYINQFIYPNPPQDEREEFSQSNIKTTYKNNVEFVSKFAESPIEKIFLNALTLNALIHRNLFIKFTEPLQPIRKVITSYRDCQEYVMNLWQNFILANGEDDGNRFILHVINSDLEEKEKSLILHHMIFNYMLMHRNVFHISLQSILDNIDELGKNIRPDVFIWIPSRPEFQLIVECDGYKFHSDVSTFTKDKQRDRILRRNGFKILRFAGREIVNHPLEKAEELYNFLLETQKVIFHKEIMEDDIIYNKKHKK